MDMNFYGAPATYGVPSGVNITPNYMQFHTQPQTPVPPINPALFETPKITAGGIKFTIVDDDNKRNVLPAETTDEKPSSTRKKKAPDGSSGIVRAKTSSAALEGTVEETPTMYTYMETTGMLRETLGQIDSLNSELMQEFETVRRNRTMKNKYNVLVGLSENVGSLINNRISVIREINSAITKSNDMDYKKNKDLKAAQAAVNDDKYIADLYKSYITQNASSMVTPQFPQIDPAIFGSGVVRADLGSNPMQSINGGSNIPIDTNYLNYMSNLTPEQNLMRYEDNPNVKQVVVYDASTGNRMFQMMDLSTGQIIPNVPVLDASFLDDTTIDIKNKIAKNINLNQTFPLVVINDNITSQY